MCGSRNAGGRDSDWVGHGDKVDSGADDNLATEQPNADGTSLL